MRLELLHTVNKLYNYCILRLKIQESPRNEKLKRISIILFTSGAIVTPLSIGPTVEEEITIDHPFMGYIYDTKAQLILFMFRKSKF